MSTIAPDILTHITTRNGDLARLLANYRDFSERLAALEAGNVGGADTVQITVQPMGQKHFAMKIPTELLRARLDALLAECATRIRLIAALPLDWIPQQPLTPAEMPATNPEGPYDV
jgi:hypothetical protein